MGAYTHESDKEDGQTEGRRDQKEFQPRRIYDSIDVRLVASMIFCGLFLE
jgi:hypothetical protein